MYTFRGQNGKEPKKRDSDSKSMQNYILSGAQNKKNRLENFDS
jgi:hypothetical protein